MAAAISCHARSKELTGWIDLGITPVLIENFKAAAFRFATTVQQAVRGGFERDEDIPMTTGSQRSFLRSAPVSAARRTISSRSISGNAGHLMLTETKATPVPIEKQQVVRVTATLISSLKKQISSGAIAPGDRFPPERELAKSFKVNRASMRQALKVLEMMGVLTPRVGDGTYLSNSADSLLGEPLEFIVLLDNLSGRDLSDTLLIVEPDLTARAAERAGPEDLAALLSAIAALESSQTNQDRVQAGFEFHDAILRAAGNRICHLLFRGIHRLLPTTHPPSFTPASIDRTLKSHRRIYTAIRSRNGPDAREAMREHLHDLRNTMEKQKTENG